MGLLLLLGLAGGLATPRAADLIPPCVLPGNIEAEDFDGRGEDVGYHVIAGRCTHPYRPADAVCMENVRGKLAVELAPGEWTAYPIQVGTGGYYRVRLHCLTKWIEMKLQVKLRLELAGVALPTLLGFALGGYEFPTNDFVQFEARSDPVHLPRGVRLLRVVCETAGGSGWLIDRLEVEEADPVLSFDAVVFAGQSGPGYADGIGVEAKFDQIAALDGDDDGNLYVADAGNRRVRRITPEATVTTLVPSVTFTDLRDLGVDGQGNCYVRDGDELRRIDRDGQVAALGPLRIPTGETSCERQTENWTELYHADEYYRVIDLAVSRGGRVAVLGRAYSSYFLRFGLPGPFGPKGDGWTRTITPLFLRSETGWTAVHTEQATLYSMHSAPYVHLCAGRQLTTGARGRGAEWLLGTDSDAASSVAAVPELLLAGESGIRPICRPFRAPTAMGHFVGDMILTHSGADGFSIVKAGQVIRTSSVSIPPRTGLVVRPGGSAFAATEHSIVRYLPDWYLALDLEVKRDPAPQAELTVVSPAPLPLRIEASFDLREWTVVTNFTASGLDRFALGLHAPGRYFRAVWIEGASR
jgi:hypothetical protein